MAIAAVPETVQAGIFVGRRRCLSFSLLGHVRKYADMCFTQEQHLWRQ